MEGKRNGGVYLPVNLSLYSYVQNRPIILFDPDGRAGYLHNVGVALKGEATGAFNSVLVAATLGFYEPEAGHFENFGSTLYPNDPDLADSFQNGHNVGFVLGTATIMLATAAESPAGAKPPKPGNYTPDRTLPRTPKGDPIPDTDVPHTQLGRSPAKYGNEPQAREWMNDENGRLVPKRDIDFTDHNMPNQHPNPHQHTLEPNNPNTAPKGGMQRGVPEPLQYP